MRRLARALMLAVLVAALVAWLVAQRSPPPRVYYDDGRPSSPSMPLPRFPRMEELQIALEN